MKLKELEPHQFGVGLADPGMELLDNGMEYWITYTFDNLDLDYKLNADSLEVLIREMVADSRYPASDYDIVEYTSGDEYPVFQIDLRVDIDPDGKTEDELYEELWPITHEMNRLNPEEFRM